MITAIAIVSFFALLLLGVPVVFVLIAVSLIFVLSDPSLLELSHVQRMIAGTQSFPLLAVPLFIMVGELANISGISSRVMGFAGLLARPLYGGLAQSNIIISTLLSGMSGSANADAAMDSKMHVPHMVKAGYPVSFAAVVTASSSLIAPMIPPGIGLIIFGYVCNISINQMFIGGIVPGLLLCAAMMTTTYFIARKRGYEPPQPMAPARDLARGALAALPAIFLPFIIIFGIRGGVFTPSESAGVAVLYVGLLCVLYRETSWRQVYEALKSSAYTTAVIMVVLAASAGLGWILTYERVPQIVGEGLLSITTNPTVMLLVIGAILFVCGMFIEGTPLILIFGPMFLPTIQQLGIDPVHYGIFFVFIVNLGGITPPVGTIMFTTCAITGVPIHEFAKASIPYVATVLLLGLLVAAVPQISTALVYL